MSGSKFVDVAQEIGELVSQKDRKYGRAYDKAEICLQIFYPNGIPLESIGDAQLISRILEKIGRIATEKHAYGEDPWMDIAGTALTGVVRGRPNAVQR